MTLLERWVLALTLMGLSACSAAGTDTQAAAVREPPSTGTDTGPSVQQLKQQAENGDRSAQWQLGSLYDTGSGAPRDGKQAVTWYWRAAEGGYAEAQNSLGSIYQAEGNYLAAVEWYRKAADRGHALALTNLAYLYDLGLGVARDRSRAFELYTKAADRGEPQAMFNIAVMYGAGQLGRKDLVQAYAWALRARRYQTNCSSEDAKLDGRVDGAIRYAEQHLTAEQIEEARGLASNWSPKGSCESMRR